MPPGMTKTGIASAAFGVSRDGNYEQVAVLYDTGAEAAAGANYFRGQTGSLGLATAPGPGQVALIQVDGSQGFAAHGGPTVVTVFGPRDGMARFVNQISGADG